MTVQELRPIDRILSDSAGDLTKGYRRSTHRLIPPEETLARVSCVLPVMGITRVANVTGLDTIGIPVVMVPPADC